MLTTTNGLSQVATKVSYWIYHGLLWILGLQALRSTWQSVKLIFIQIPEGEVKLATDQLTQADVNFLINDAILTVLSAFISFSLVTIFIRSKNKAAQALRILVSLGMIIINAWLWSYFENQNSSILVQPLIYLLI
ncbi:MAG TPA: hypothetical protein VGA89_01715 [Patescibacteria group bacterium]|jgi:hypothetical protein